jgi:uncharacterized OsmC-like protein
MTQLAPALDASPLPFFCRVENGDELGLEPPPARRGLAVRTLVRSLRGMQKEALVTSSASGATWRVASDEGPYLAGTDLVPPPLGFLSAGFAASVAAELLAAAERREAPLANLRAVTDSYYSMEGSALEGSMRGGALPPEVQVEVETPLAQGELRELVAEAVAASPINGLMARALNSRFTLTLNGERIEAGRVAPIEAANPPRPGALFEEVRGDGGPGAEELIVKVEEAESRQGVEGGAGSSLKAEQSRTLHVRADCAVREDGIKVIDQFLFKPIGSRFRFLSDEAPGHGGEGRAPGAATYLAAGFALCFMTQLGRYAKITRRALDSYEVVQDNHFTARRAGAPCEADPIETHVYLDADEEVDVARAIVDMGEQTCFLHALCRTVLEPRIAANALPAG